MALLTQKQQDTYENNGFLVVRNAIPLEVINNFIDVLKDVVDSQTKVMYRDKEISDLYLNEPFSTRWYKVWQNHGGKPEHHTWHSLVFSQQLYALIEHPAILDIVESLLGPEIQHNGDWIVRPKLPEMTSQLLPWHQDSAYMVDTEQYHYPTVWVPLVPVNKENGAMQLIPCTHKLPIQEHDKKTGTLNTPLNDPAENREVVMPEFQLGDFIIFHNHLFHRSTAGHAPSVRWSMDFRFSPAGTPIDETLWYREMRRLVRSKKNPQQIPDWTKTLAMWEGSEQKNRKAI